MNNIHVAFVFVFLQKRFALQTCDEEFGINEPHCYTDEEQPSANNTYKSGCRRVFTACQCPCSVNEKYKTSVAFFQNLLNMFLNAENYIKFLLQHELCTVNELTNFIHLLQKEGMVV